MKRFAGLILVFVMLLVTLPALADTTRTSGDFQYTLKSNGTATIVGYTGSGDSIIIPQMLDGYTVTTIGDSAFDNKYKSYKNCPVTLPNTINLLANLHFGIQISPPSISQAVLKILEKVHSSVAIPSHTVCLQTIQLLR